MAISRFLFVLGVAVSHFALGRASRQELRCGPFVSSDVQCAVDVPYGSYLSLDCSGSSDRLVPELLLSDEPLEVTVCETPERTVIGFDDCPDNEVKFHNVKGLKLRALTDRGWTVQNNILSEDRYFQGSCRSEDGTRGGFFNALLRGPPRPNENNGELVVGIGMEGVTGGHICGPFNVGGFCHACNVVVSFGATFLLNCSGSSDMLYPKGLVSDNPVDVTVCETKYPSPTGKQEPCPEKDLVKLSEVKGIELLSITPESWIVRNTMAGPDRIFQGRCGDGSGTKCGFFTALFQGSMVAGHCGGMTTCLPPPLPPPEEVCGPFNTSDVRCDAEVGYGATFKLDCRGSDDVLVPADLVSEERAAIMVCRSKEVRESVDELCQEEDEVLLSSIEGIKIVSTSPSNWVVKNLSSSDLQFQGSCRNEEGTRSGFFNADFKKADEGQLPGVKCGPFEGKDERCDVFVPFGSYFTLNCDGSMIVLIPERLIDVQSDKVTVCEAKPRGSVDERCPEGSEVKFASVEGVAFASARDNGWTVLNNMLGPERLFQGSCQGWNGSGYFNARFGAAPVTLPNPPPTTPVPVRPTVD